MNLMSHIGNLQSKTKLWVGKQNVDNRLLLRGLTDIYLHLQKKVTKLFEKQSGNLVSLVQRFFFSNSKFPENNEYLSVKFTIK